MFARKPIAIALAMTIAALSGGFVATSSAQAADDCQVTITGGDVTAFKAAMNDASKTVVCVSGEFTFTEIGIYPAQRENLTIKGSPTAIFKTTAFIAMYQSYILITTGGEEDSGVLNLNVQNINFESTQQQSSALRTQNITIKNSTFKNFKSNNYGGAVYAIGNVVVENSEFIDNSASQSGGAIHSEIGNVTVNDSIFKNNVSEAGYGGAISAANGSKDPLGGFVVIADSNFELNRVLPAGSSGGAIYLQNGDINVSSSTFSNNSGLEAGGSIHLQECFRQNDYLDIADSTFFNNDAYDGGAIFAGSNCIIKGNNLTFNGNEALNEGGAIFTHGGEVKFSTFLDNLAATPSLGNDTPGNSIYYGTFNSQQTNCSPELDLGANIFANSSAHPEIGIGGVLCTQKVTDIGSNIFSTQSEPDLISAGSLSFANASIFGKTVTEIFGSATPALSDNGGSTKTIALTSGSPAIDFAASGGISANAVAKDQRGFDRIGASDAGAYEFGAVAAVVTPPTQNSTPTTETSTASSATSATTTKTLAATGSSASTWGLSALAGLITVLGVSSLRSASRSSKN